jgi:hypothetical protein
MFKISTMESSKLLFESLIDFKLKKKIHLITLKNMFTSLLMFMVYYNV